MKKFLLMISLFISSAAFATGIAAGNFGFGGSTVEVPENASVEEIKAILNASDITNPCDEGIDNLVVNNDAISFDCWADSLGSKTITLSRKSAPAPKVVNLAANTTYVGDGYSVTLEAGEYTFEGIEKAINYADVTDDCTDGFSVEFASPSELVIDCWADSLGVKTIRMNAQ